VVAPLQHSGQRVCRVVVGGRSVAAAQQLFEWQQQCRCGSLDPPAIAALCVLWGF
jgi:hypothetical protein